MPKKTKKTKKTTQKQRQKQSVNVKVHIDQSKRTAPRQPSQQNKARFPAPHTQSLPYPSMVYNSPLLPLADNRPKTEDLTTTNQLLNALVAITTQSPQFDYYQRAQNNSNPSYVSHPIDDGSTLYLDNSVPSQFQDHRQITNGGLTAEAVGMTSKESLDDETDDAEQQIKNMGYASAQETVENGFKKSQKNVIFADSDSEPEKVDLDTASNINPKKTVGRPAKEKKEKAPSKATPAQQASLAKAREAKKKKYGSVTVEDVDEGYETGY